MRDALMLVMGWWISGVVLLVRGYACGAYSFEGDDAPAWLKLRVWAVAYATVLPAGLAGPFADIIYPTLLVVGDESDDDDE